MGKKSLFIKRLLILICTVAIFFIIASCGLTKTDDSKEVNDLQQTRFEMDIEYLSDKNIKLPDLPSDSTMMEKQFLSLITETYESLGGEIDISKVNPRNGFSDAVKKMTMIEAYDSYFIKNDMLDSDLDYGTVAYWLMNLQDAIQKRVYFRHDSTARINDLLKRINVSTVLHTWKEDVNDGKYFTLDDLLEGQETSEQILTKLMVAEMMVAAYEDVCGEIQTTRILKPKDTDDINAWKSNEFFFWSESRNFEPEETGNWNDWAFMSAIIYDSQLRLGLKLDEYKVPYGAVVAALTSMVKGYEGAEQNLIEEKIVLNERPYNWYVSQQETGEYSDVNCMPTCVEMAMRYQGMSDVPSVEKLRKDNPLNGLGWNDVLAEDVMLQYGLKFTDSFDINLDKMLDLLDNKNILYVMYNEPGSQMGHSVIIKGYWKLGSSVNFIVSDPNYNIVGPFGYLEYTKDASTMLSDMERHVPRYFIIPKGE